ncbi:MAG TPA: hypothetical protein DD670_12865 [Planctomycetaceae bacterium]|nr:hypothetical protein [Planctomycetaceae bacterium]
MIAVFVALLLVLNLTGALAIKVIGRNVDDIAIVMGTLAALLVVYAGRAVVWLMVGKRYQLSYAYPLMSINYPVAFFIGIYVFGEYFSHMCLIGTLIITLGVACIASSRHRKDEGAGR